MTTKEEDKRSDFDNCWFLKSSFLHCAFHNVNLEHFSKTLGKGKLNDLVLPLTFVFLSEAKTKHLLSRQVHLRSACIPSVKAVNLNTLY